MLRAVARVQKIIQAEEEALPYSKNAAFAIAIATEMFVYYLSEQSYHAAKADKQNHIKRSLNYKDVATAVATRDNLEFLTDVVPKTITYKQYREKKAKEEKVKAQAIANVAAGAAILSRQKKLEEMAKRGSEDVEMQDATDRVKINAHDAKDSDEEFPQMKHTGAASRHEVVGRARYDSSRDRNGYDRDATEKHLPVEE